MNGLRRAEGLGGAHKKQKRSHGKEWGDASQRQADNYAVPAAEHGARRAPSDAEVADPADGRGSKKKKRKREALAVQGSGDMRAAAVTVTAAEAAAADDQQVRHKKKRKKHKAAVELADGGAS